MPSIKSCVDKLNTFLVAQEKGLGLFGFFGFQGKKQVMSLIDLLNAPNFDPNLAPKQNAHQAIKKINTYLSDPQQFSDPKLRALLNSVKEDLIKFIYNNKVFIYRGDTESWNNYKNLNELAIGFPIKAGNYYGQRTLHEWLEFASYQTTPYQTNENDCGWKLHFSFDRTTPGNLEKGMNIVLQHLVEKNIPSFKIMPENKAVSPSTVGKDMTVYLSDNRPISEWDNLINEIENSLAEAGVIPGPQAKDTHMIQEGRFTSYRNDKGTNGQYTQQGFNPANEPDELQNIHVAISHIATHSV